MKKYRKKPVVVEAVEWKSNLKDLVGFESGRKMFLKEDELYIETLEGTMKANVGDFIIKGVNGELYPCKPDIFWKTYEMVEEGI